MKGTIRFENSDGTRAVVVIEKLCCWQECQGRTRLYFDGGQTFEVGADFDEFTRRVLSAPAAGGE